MEETFPGTLLNNCGFDLWQERYVKSSHKTSEGYPWNGRELVHASLSKSFENRERHISRWAVQCTFKDHAAKLFGCTEDIRCLASDSQHSKDYEETHFCRRRCSECEVPICRDCHVAVVMVVANAHWNGSSVCKNGHCVVCFEFLRTVSADRHFAL